MYSAEHTTGSGKGAELQYANGIGNSPLLLLQNTVKWNWYDHPGDTEYGKKKGRSCHGV